MHKFLLLLFISILCACSLQREASPIDVALASDHPAIQKVMNNLPAHEVQILFTQIDRDSLGQPSFTTYGFQEDENNYFYPASSVKWPAAVLALEKLNEVDSVHMDTPYTIARDTLTHTIADDVRQLFAVSDNEAFNRLYELLGSNYLDNRLREIATTTTNYEHRLSTANSNNKQRDTLFFENNITLGGGYDEGQDIIFIEKVKKGKGYMKDGELVNEPMDFSQKNYFSLETHHELLQKLIFPSENGFKLSEKDRKYLLNAMSTPPFQQGYNREEYYDSYGKFFMYGDTKDPMPSHIKIFNKVGYAYGTLTDIAYIVDEKNDLDFFLSATILVNQNGIFNDDTYEYDEIGIPFLAQLGREIHSIELGRKK